MSKLWEISEEYAKAFEAVGVDSESGELIGMDKLEAVGGELVEKLEAVALFLKNEKSLIADIKAEEDALAARRKAHENKVKWLSEYVGHCMDEVGYKEFETAKCKLSFRKSVSTQVTDVDLLPAELFKITETRKPDLTAIKKLLSDGQEVPGAVLIENKNLQIK